MVSHVRPSGFARPVDRSTRIVPPAEPDQSELDADREKIGFTADVTLRLALERQLIEPIEGTITVFEKETKERTDLADTA